MGKLKGDFIVANWLLYVLIFVLTLAILIGLIGAGISTPASGSGGWLTDWIAGIFG